MNKSVENYIKEGMTVLSAYALVPNPMKSEYKGYLASFGASVIMSGLVPTIAFYSNPDASSERKKVLEWMFLVLKTKVPYNSITGSLFIYALNLPENEKKKLEKELLDISIALKLCIRTFNLV